MGFLGADDKTINILFTNNEGIREYNRKFLKRDRPTNVIAFSYILEDQTYNPEKIIGDIVISVEKASEEAKEAGYLFYERLIFLLIHGILHVLGYDHEKDEKEKRRMRYMEEKLERLVKSNPLFLGLAEGEKKGLY